MLGSVATAQSNAPHIDQVVQLFHCATETLSESEDHLQPSRLLIFRGNIISVNGALGWHTTWNVLVDANVTPIVIYDTLRPDAPVPFARIATPSKLIQRLEACGATWGGTWQGTLPALPDQNSLQPFPSVKQNSK
jgi:hypothetical protein